MASAGTVSSLVEVAMQEHGGSTLLSASRTTEDTHVVGIHIGIFLCRSLDPQFAVGEAGILQVLVANLLKLLASVGSAHGIELHHDEAEFGKGRGCPVVGLEVLGRIGVAGTGIDIFDDGIFLLRVEVGGSLDDAPHVGLSVPALRHEHLGLYPTVLLQRGDVGSLKGLHEFAGLSVTQYGDGSLVHLGVGVHEIAVVIGVLGVVVALLGSECHHVLAVHTYLIIMYQVGIFVLVHATG